MNQEEKRILIQTKHLTKTYHDGEMEVEALRDVNLTVREGEMIAIMGKSGSGKSTLLNILSTADEATKGTYLFEGNDITRITEREKTEYRRHKIAVIYQSFQLIPELTVQENIALPYVIAGEKTDDSRILAIAAELGLSDRLSFFPEKLSGGERQRTAIARALIADPPVLLADEPTGNLDSQNGKNVMDLFVACAKEMKKSIIMVTHDQEIAAYADRVVTLLDGKLME